MVGVSFNKMKSLGALGPPYFKDFLIVFTQRLCISHNVYVIWYSELFLQILVFRVAWSMRTYLIILIIVIM